MSPTLALILCIVFVLFLLRLERKQSPEVSLALWIPTIWMLYIASKPLAHWFGSTGDPAEGSPLDRVFQTVLFCLTLFILVWRKFDWFRAIKENPWLMLLISYMFVSIAWSDIPYISFKRWIRELVAVVMAFLVLSEQDPHQAMESVLRRTVYILIPFSMLLIKYFPHYGVEYGRWSGGLMWVGVTMQKNGLGRLCLIALFFLVWSLVKRWQGSDIPVNKYQAYTDVFVLIITLRLLAGPANAYPATAVVSLAAGLAFFIILLWMKKSRAPLGANTLVVIVALIILLGFVTPMVGGSTISGFTSSVGRDVTLTGRTEIWARLLPVAEQRPILGYGFGGFWTPTTRQAYNIGEAHSGYLEIILELGFVGMLLFSMFLLACCRMAQRALVHDYDWGSLWICFLIIALIHNVTESSINSFTSQLTAVILFLTVSVPKNHDLPQRYIL